MQSVNFMEKLNELAQKEGFVDKAKAARNPAEAIAVLNEYGWSISAEEFQAGVAPILEEMNGVNVNGELDETALENVSGGVASLLLGIAGVIVFAWLAGGFRRGFNKC